MYCDIQKTALSSSPYLDTLQRLKLKLWRVWN